MKKPLAGGALALLLTGNVIAEEYQIFSKATYGHGEYSEGYSLYGKYFFDKKKTMGPLNEFKYINTVSSVSAAAYLTSPLDSKTASLRGEWIDGAFGLGASVNFHDTMFDSGYASSQAVAKYFFSSNLFAGVTYWENDDGDSSTGAIASYEQALTGNDYIGFSGSYIRNNEPDDSNWSIQSKYYNDLGNGNYWVVRGNYSQTQYDKRVTDSRSWSLGTTYYFSERTRIGADYAEYDYGDGFNTVHYRGSATHYFTQNFYVTGTYTKTKYDLSPAVDRDAYYLTAGLQY